MATGTGRFGARENRPSSVLVPPTSPASSIGGVCNPTRAMIRKVPEPGELTARDVLARYPNLRDDHLRFLEKWGLVRPGRTASGRTYGFRDLAAIRQAAGA